MTDARHLNEYRPVESASGFQTWDDLLFLHWRVPISEVQSGLPDGLTADVYDDSAWIGLIPFSMKRVRPWWAPPVPGISWFLETNIRTYVRDRHGRTGVWFFSLDCSNPLAVCVARTFWHLNYVHCRMDLSARDGLICCTGQRSEDPSASYEVTAVTDATSGTEPAPDDSLESFLVNRYRLFSSDRSGRLYTGQVDHAPYQLTPAVLRSFCGSLIEAETGLTCARRLPDHVTAARAVDVRVGQLRPLSE